MAAANNDRPPLLRAVYANNVVECRRLISKIQGRLMPMEIYITFVRTVLLGVPDPGGE